MSANRTRSQSSQSLSPFRRIAAENRTSRNDWTQNRCTSVLFGGLRLHSVVVGASLHRPHVLARRKRWSVIAPHLADRRDGAFGRRPKQSCGTTQSVLLGTAVYGSSWGHRKNRPLSPTAWARGD